ncbi:hypothetical protein [Labrys sp. 22185]|uniref:hypothetical protein n=1 Tax=Labrys sp. 22185 TaxID=3453888 RepID=UPI003F85CC04
MHKDNTAALPKVVTMGLHSSASTWVFNVIRELLIVTHGEERVVSYYAEDAPQASTFDGNCLVLKSHHGSKSLNRWIECVKPILFLSIRDPRDAALSMSQRFDVPLSMTAQWVSNDCQQLINFSSRGYPLLRYEDSFFNNPQTLIDMANLLNCSIGNQSLDFIFNTYTTDSVRKFVNDIASLPDERVRPHGGGRLVDVVTNFNSRHIGDGRSGKWRDLPQSEQDILTRKFESILKVFNYPL